MNEIHEKDSEDRLRSAIEAYHAWALAYAAAKLGLPDRMSARPWTAQALAAELGLSAPHLLRFLRGLVAIGISLGTLLSPERDVEHRLTNVSIPAWAARCRPAASARFETTTAIGDESRPSRCASMSA